MAWEERLNEQFIKNLWSENDAKIKLIFYIWLNKKNTSTILDDLLISEIEHAYETLGLLFDNVKAVPDIQKMHSMTVLDINQIECKIYSNSTEKTVVNF
jgi:hypothetical protein